MPTTHLANASEGGLGVDREMARRALKILTRAQKLIAKPHGWVRGKYYAKRTGWGDVYSVSSGIAIAGGADCFCAVGAIEVAALQAQLDLGTTIHTEKLAIAALADVIRPRNVSMPDAHNTVTSWNDMTSRRQADVVAAFERARALLKSRMKTFPPAQPSNPSV